MGGINGGYCREKEKGKVYEIVIEMGKDPATGKRKRMSRTFRGTEKQATKEMNRLLNELNLGTYIQPTKMTVAQYLEKWMGFQKDKLAPRTYQRYQQIINLRIIPELGRIILEELKPMQLQEFYARLQKGKRLDGKEGTLSIDSVMYHHRILRVALNQAVKWQMIRYNPADAVDTPKQKRNTFTALDEVQAKRLLKLVEGERHYLAVLLAVSTGLRRGEIYGLRWEDIDFSRKTLTVNQAVKYLPGEGLIFGPPKNEFSRRTIPLPEKVLNSLHERRGEQQKWRQEFGTDYQENGLVLCQETGEPTHPDTISSWFQKFLAKHDLPKIRFHDLRHTHATLLLLQHEDTKVVSERLGHASIVITADLYSHVLPSMQKGATDKIESLLFDDD